MKSKNQEYSLKASNTSYLRDLGLYGVESRFKYNGLVSAFDEKKQLLIHADDYRFKIININTFDITEISYPPTGYRPRFIVFHNQDKTFFCVHERGSVEQFDMETGKYKTLFSMSKYERRAISKVFFSSYHQALILLKSNYGEIGELQFLNINSCKIEDTWALNIDYKNITLSKDSSYLVGWYEDKQLIDVFDFKSRKLLQSIESNLKIENLKLTSDNAFILCASSERVYSYELKTGLRKQIFTVNRGYNQDFVISNNNRTLMVYDGDAFHPKLSYFDLKNGNRLAVIDCFRADFIHLDEDNMVLLIVNYKGFNPIQYKPILTSKEIHWGLTLLLIELAARSESNCSFTLTPDVRSLIYSYYFLLNTTNPTSYSYETFLKLGLFKPQKIDLNNPESIAKNQALLLDVYLDNKLPKEEPYCSVMNSICTKIKNKKFITSLNQSDKFQSRLENLALHFELIKNDKIDITAYKVASMIHLLILFKDTLTGPEQGDLRNIFDSLIATFCKESDLDLRKVKRVPVNSEVLIEKQSLGCVVS
jgi:hypothetical protein